MGGKRTDLRPNANQIIIPFTDENAQRQQADQVKEERPEHPHLLRAKLTETVTTNNRIGEHGGLITVQPNTLKFGR
jgi:hypothetical protein